MIYDIKRKLNRRKYCNFGPVPRFRRRPRTFRVYHDDEPVVTGLRRERVSRIQKFIAVLYCLLIFSFSTLFVPWKTTTPDGTYSATAFAPIWAPPPTVNLLVAVDYERVLLLSIAITIIAVCLYCAFGAPKTNPSTALRHTRSSGKESESGKTVETVRDSKVLATFGIVLGLLYGAGVGVVYRLPLTVSVAASIAGAVFWGGFWAKYPTTSFRNKLVGGTLGGIFGGAISQSLIIAFIDGLKVDVLIGTTFVGGVFGGCVGLTAGLVILPMYYYGCKRLVRKCPLK